MNEAWFKREALKPEEAQPLIEKVQASADKLGLRLFIVGGYVRDEIMGREPKDLDFMAEGEDQTSGIQLADQVAKDYGGKAFEQNEKTGTAKVVLDSHELDFAAPRKETYKPGDRTPETEHGTLEQDAHRRDFTINALFKDAKTGEVLDLTGKGKKDIEDGIIRVTDPANADTIFTEDPLRMLRAIRQSQAFGFEIEEGTMNALKNNVDDLDTISRERVRDEFDKILKGPNPTAGVRMLQETGLMAKFMPEYEKMVGFEQKNPKHHHLDVAEHTLSVMDSMKEMADHEGWDDDKRQMLMLAALLHDISKPEAFRMVDDVGKFHGHEDVGAKTTEEILKRLKYPNDLIKKIVHLVGMHMRPHGYQKDWSDKAVRKYIKEIGDSLDDALALAEADTKGGEPSSHEEKNELREDFKRRIKEIQESPGGDPRDMSPILNGNDLMEIADEKGGPWLREVLDWLMEQQMENPEMTQDEARELVKNQFPDRFKEKEPEPEPEQEAPETEQQSWLKEAESDEYDYGSTQIDMPPNVAEKLLEIGKTISEADLAEGGREDDAHVTVKFGLHTSDPSEVAEVIQGFGTIVMKVSGVSMFPGAEDKDYDVVKFDIESPQLHDLNAKVSDALETTDTFPEYEPHMTIAYVRKGKGKEYSGDSQWAQDQMEKLGGEEIVADTVQFSSKSGDKTPISLSTLEASLWTKEADKLPGGKGDNLSPDDFNPAELAKGTKEEQEHTNDAETAQEIAMDHLTENPWYYTELEQKASLWLRSNPTGGWTKKDESGPNILIGTSGFSYNHWAGTFYPKSLKRKDRLSYYADRFPTVEVSTTFHQIPEERVLKAWCDRTPENFMFALRGPREVTHKNRLIDCSHIVNSFMKRVAVMGNKLGLVTFQLQESAPLDPAALRTFAAALPSDFRYSMEFRAEPWFCDEVYEILEKYDIALVTVGHSNIPVHTKNPASWSHVRMSGSNPDWRLNSYTTQELRNWSGIINDSKHPAFIHFNNEYKAFAALNASEMMRILRLDKESMSADASGISPKYYGPHRGDTGAQNPPDNSGADPNTTGPENQVQPNDTKHNKRRKLKNLPRDQDKPTMDNYPGSTAEAP